MKKVAVIYYSMSGNTDYVAKHISENIDVDLIRIIPKKAYHDKGFKKFFWGGKSAVMGEKPALENYEFDDSKYDCIIIGTPVWASTFAPPIRTFINENKEKLINKEIAICISYSGGGADKTIEKLKDYIGVDDFKSELILIDPKDKESEENIEKIKAFCEDIQK